MGFLKKLSAKYGVTAKSMPSEKVWPSSLDKKLKSITDKEEQEAIKSFWVDLIKKYPDAKKNWGAASNILEARWKKMMAKQYGAL